MKNNSLVLLLGSLSLIVMLQSTYLIQSYILMPNNIIINDSDMISGLIAVNSSVAIAFLVSMVTGRLFEIKKKNLKRIARNSYIFIIFTSSIMPLSYIFGIYGISACLVLLFLNAIKFYDISKSILDVF